MDKKIITLLNKIYFHENGDYNLELDRLEHTIPSSVSTSDLALLKEQGLSPNNFKTFTHDNALKRFLKIKESENFTQKMASGLFLKGLTGDFPRGRQALISFVYLKHLEDHKFEGKDTCTICGLPKKETLDITEELYSRYEGHSWNEFPLHFLVDIEDLLEKGEEISVKENDRKLLFELLDLIAEANPKETPGKLEKRIAGSKILKNTDKYKRYGILLALAECGILPNAFIKPYFEEFTTLTARLEASENLTTSHRSDIVLPLGGWKGSDPVDFKKAEKIFGKR
jgi:hypothetical protein